MLLSPCSCWCPRRNSFRISVLLSWLTSASRIVLLQCSYHSSRPSFVRPLSVCPSVSSLPPYLSLSLLSLSLLSLPISLALSLSPLPPCLSLSLSLLSLPISTSPSLSLSLSNPRPLSLKPASCFYLFQVVLYYYYYYYCYYCFYRICFSM